jgi:hypothetical protein
MDLAPPKEKKKLTKLSHLVQVIMVTGILLVMRVHKVPCIQSSASKL